MGGSPMRLAMRLRLLRHGVDVTDYRAHAPSIRTMERVPPSNCREQNRKGGPVNGEQLLMIGVGAVALLWLVVLPLRLSKGILHRLGYHAHCGNNCEVGVSVQSVKAQLREEFKKGMREGMRGRATFGAQQSAEMAGKYSLLPEWKPEKNDSEFIASVKEKYDKVRFAFDAQDDLNMSGTALAVALGVALRETDDPRAAVARVMAIVSEYAGVTESPAT